MAYRRKRTRRRRGSRMRGRRMGRSGARNRRIGNRM